MNPDLFLYLGDVYEKGSATEFQNWYGSSPTYFGPFRSKTNPVVGNHEYEGLTAPGYFNYWDNIPHYYSYNAAGWHFIALDSTSQFGQTDPGTAQFNWLQADLASNHQPCTLAYFHHPVFSVGQQGDTPRMNAIWSLGQAMFTKCVIVVDEDVDVQNIGDVTLKVLNHIDPERDIQFTLGPVDSLDHASRLPNFGSKMGIDATNKWPGETSRHWGTPIRMSNDVRKRVDTLWASLGIDG